MASTTNGNTLPTEMRTERLILRSADMSIDADSVKLNYIRCNASGGPRHGIKPGPEAHQQLRHKQRVHGPREELCTLATAPRNIFWLMWLPSADLDTSGDDLTNLVGLIGMSSRQEMPVPDMGYITVGAHAGHSYASEAGKEVLHYWRDLVGVKEIFVGCPVSNKQSQRCAERIGFVRGGTLQFEIGKPPNAELEDAIAYVLPGMEWKEGQIAKPVQGWQSDDEKEQVEPASVQIDEPVVIG